MKREWIKLLTISLLLVGCGENEVTTTATPVAAAPSAKHVAEKTPTHKAINNRGQGVEGKMGHYTVKLFAEAPEASKPQERHQGVVVKYEGLTSETMAIQASYHGKKIRVGIYDGSTLVKLSEPVLVTEDPVVVISL